MRRIIFVDSCPFPAAVAVMSYTHVNYEATVAVPSWSQLNVLVGARLSELVNADLVVFVLLGLRGASEVYSSDSFFF